MDGIGLSAHPRLTPGGAGARADGDAARNRHDPRDKSRAGAGPPGLLAMRVACRAGRARPGASPDRHEEDQRFHLAARSASPPWSSRATCSTRSCSGISLAEIWAASRAIPPHRFLLAALSTARRLRGARLVRPDRAAAPRRPPHLVALRLGLLVHHLRALAQYRRLGLLRRPGALPRLHGQGAVGRPGRRAGGPLLLHLRPRHDPARRLRPRRRPDTCSRASRASCPAFLTDPATARILGAGMLGFVALYVLGSLLHLKPLTIRTFKLEYPRPRIMGRQLIAAPLELLGAAGIIYFALPEAGEPRLPRRCWRSSSPRSRRPSSRMPRAASACSSSSSSRRCPIIDAARGRDHRGAARLPDLLFLDSGPDLGRGRARSTSARVWPPRSARARTVRRRSRCRSRR